MHSISYYNDLLVNKNKKRNEEVDLELFWDSRAESFSDMQSKQREEIPSRVINYLIANNLINKKSKVLDIGGGSGRYAIPLAKVADKVAITDISSKMLEYAQLNAEKEGVDNLEYVKLIRSSIIKLNFLDLKDQIECPDLIVLFTNTVSHKMATIAVQQAKKNNVVVARSHSSSGSALKEILDTYIQ